MTAQNAIAYTHIEPHFRTASITECGLEDYVDWDSYKDPVNGNELGYVHFPRAGALPKREGYIRFEGENGGAISMWR